MYSLMKIDHLHILFKKWYLLKILTIFVIYCKLSIENDIIMIENKIV